VAVGDPEWLATHVAAKKLKRHRVIETDNAHYLQGTGNTEVKNLKLKTFSLEISFKWKNITNIHSLASIYKLFTGTDPAFMQMARESSRLMACLPAIVTSLCFWRRQARKSSRAPSVRRFQIWPHNRP
jgi:hypothetical protein